MSINHTGQVWNLLFIIFRYSSGCLPRALNVDKPSVYIIMIREQTVRSNTWADRRFQTHYHASDLKTMCDHRSFYLHGLTYY